MKKILFLVLALILTACGAAAPQVTVTLTPTVTFTVTPSFTATPTFTPTPTLTSDQQRTLDATNAVLAGVWTIDNGGAVTDANGSAPEGIVYSVEEGLLKYTYMYEGKEITVDLVQNIQSPPLEGCVARFDAKCLTNDGKIATVTFSSTGGYGYEGDGNPEHKDNVKLRSVMEQHLTLINPDMVNLGYRDAPQWDSRFDGDKLVVKNLEGEKVFNEGTTGLFWGDKMIYLPDGNGGFIPVESTSFAITRLEDYPNISATFYLSNDDVVEMMLSDVTLDFSWDEYFKVKPGKDMYRYMGNWSKWYDFDAGRLTSFE